MMGTQNFYKFQSVKNDDLSKDDALDALFNSYAVFSGRKNFNDLFDSKIDIVYPTPQQVLNEINRNNIIEKMIPIVSGWISNGEFTPAATQSMREFESIVNDDLDTYAIYCLSKYNNSNLLWAHYANSHTGFCFELEFSGVPPLKATYQEHIGTIPLLDWFVKINSSHREDISIEQLLVKLHYWSYEGEYRWIAQKSLVEIPKNVKIVKLKFDPNLIKTTAVIFGCRMPSCVKNFIRTNLPYKAEFQQAVARKDYIEIVPFNECVHLEAQCSHCVEKLNRIGAGA